MLSLNYEVYGEKKQDMLPVILLHGWATSLDFMRDFALGIAAYTQVYSIDLPGHGKSPEPEGVWGMKDFAECVKGFLDEKGIHTAIFIGHSFGGKTSIKLASLYPQYVSKLVLIGASGIRPVPSLKKRFRNYLLRVLRNLIRFKNTRVGKMVYEKWYIPRFASRDYLAAGSLRQTFVKTVNEELYEELSQIKVPCLLIWGEQDDESPLVVGKEMNQRIGHSELKIIVNQGHYPFIGSTSALVLRYIRDFIRRPS